MGQSIFESSPEFAGVKEGARVGTVVVGSGGLVVMGPRRTKKTQRGWGRGLLLGRLRAVEVEDEPQTLDFVSNGCKID